MEFRPAKPTEDDIFSNVSIPIPKRGESIVKFRDNTEYNPPMVQPRQHQASEISNSASGKNPTESYMREAQAEREFEAKMKAIDNHILNKLNEDITPGVDSSFLFHIFSAILLPILLYFVLGVFAAPIFWFAAFRYAVAHDEPEIGVIYGIAGFVPLMVLYLAPGTANLMDLMFTTWSFY